VSADLPTIDYLDELVDTDPARLLDEAIALRARAERAEAAIGRARALWEEHRARYPLERPCRCLSCRMYAALAGAGAIPEEQTVPASTTEETNPHA